MNLVQIIIMMHVVKSYAYDENNVTIATTSKPFHISGYKYLDDVVYGLKNQNWTDEELPCLNATLHWITNLQNFTTWAVWEWDSLSSQPVGLLSGNLHNLGNFDQCMTSPWKTHHPEIKSQYCLANIEFYSDSNETKRWDEIEPYGNAMEMVMHKTDHVRKSTRFAWGLCVPSICQRKSVERFVKVLLARSHLGTADLHPNISVNEACQKPDKVKNTDAAFHAYMAFVMMMFAVTVVCTFISNRSNANGFCKAFCIKRNSRNLLNISKDGFESISGIRFLTMFFIVMCHVSGFTVIGPLSNGVKTDQFIQDMGWFINHSDLTVDTFFLVSGLLVAKTLLGYNTLPPLPLLVFRRYVRLAVGLAVTVLFMAAVLPYTGSGPIWNSVSDVEAGCCRENWWISLLMLGNYINTNRICLIPSWYIPNDFHFFCIAVILLTVYKRNIRLGKISTYIIISASMITSGVVHYVNDFPPVFIMDFEHYAAARENPQITNMYIRSHNRAAAYFVGVLAGFMYNERKNRGHFNLSKKRSIMYACFALLVMMGALVMGSSYQKRSYSVFEGVLYGAVNRPVYAAALALLIMTCAFGEVPLLSGFLKWYPWVPLSRLAYGVYLVHYVIIIRNAGILRSIGYYDDFNILSSTVGVTGISVLLSYIMWLFFEAPINNLVTLFLLRKNKHQSENGKEIIIAPTVTETDHKEGAKSAPV